MCVQETEQEVAQREDEVDRNVRINLQLQEDVAAARKDVDERTEALSSAIKVRSRLFRQRATGARLAHRRSLCCVPPCMVITSF